MDLAEAKVFWEDDFFEFRSVCHGLFADFAAFGLFGGDLVEEFWFAEAFDVLAACGCEDVLLLCEAFVLGVVC